MDNTQESIMALKNTVNIAANLEILLQMLMEKGIIDKTEYDTRVNKRLEENKDNIDRMDFIIKFNQIMNRKEFSEEDKKYLRENAVKNGACSEEELEQLIKLKESTASNIFDFDTLMAYSGLRNKKENSNDIQS
jgi:hypothetical protein